MATEEVAKALALSQDQGGETGHAHERLREPQPLVW
jgi:hypothetical protein